MRYESLSSTHPSYRIPYLTKRDRVTLAYRYKGLTPKKFIFKICEEERGLLHLVATIPVPYMLQGDTLTIVSGSVF